MYVYAVDPLRDARWAELVARHPDASVFHTRAWLRALHDTYGFTAVAFTTSPPSTELRNAIVLAKVHSWLTGHRLVSLPFADHCQPLADARDDLAAVCAFIVQRRRVEGFGYVEVRPATVSAVLGESLAEAGCRVSRSYALHRLDLQPELETLRRGCHKDSIQRKIRRAERESLTYDEGRSDLLLQKLWGLLDVTRRRHGVPLQPLAWFRRLIAAFGDNLSIRVASKDGQPAAAMLTLLHGDTMVYKYGGSDTRLNAMGGMPFLFWKTIEDAKRQGSRTLDLGRSDAGNAGLIRFKEHLGAARSTLTYWRAPGEARAASDGGWTTRVAGRVLVRLPGPLRRQAGGLLYRHLG